jgi:hypothetical protein
MTTQAGVETKERDFLAQCVGDAYQMLDLCPVWIRTVPPWCGWVADQFLQLRRGDCPPAHATTL